MTAEAYKDSPCSASRLNLRRIGVAASCAGEEGMKSSLPGKVSYGDRAHARAHTFPIFLSLLSLKGSQHERSCQRLLTSVLALLKLAKSI